MKKKIIGYEDAYSLKTPEDSKILYKKCARNRFMVLGYDKRKLPRS